MHNASNLPSQDKLDQWLIQATLILLGSATVILFIGQYTDLDLLLTDYFFDTQQRIFPWDHTWFARNLMHGYVKNVLVWSGFILMGLAILDLVRPFAQLSSIQRAKLRVIALSAFLEPILIKTLKEKSSMHCPWDIDRYNGSHPFLRLLDTIPDGWQAGHCFPAGHASSAMWLTALAVLWLPTNPKRATKAYLGGLSVGLILGWVQQMRGQHFLTHTLWTAWLASALAILLIAIFSRQLAPRPAKTESTPLTPPSPVTLPHGVNNAA